MKIINVLFVEENFDLTFVYKTNVIKLTLLVLLVLPGVVV